MSDDDIPPDAIFTEDEVMKAMARVGLTDRDLYHDLLQAERERKLRRAAERHE